MKVQIQAVIMTDGNHYVIHGVDSTTTAEMFKALEPIWKFDPMTETAHVVTFTVEVPDIQSAVIVIPEYFNPHEAVIEHHHEDLKLTIVGDDPRMELTLDDLKFG